LTLCNMPEDLKSSVLPLWEPQILHHPYLNRKSDTFSSLGATTSFFERCGLLNIKFPLIAILDTASPILYFQFLYVIYCVIFPSVLWSP
jgi:hypothetical protein